MTLKMNPIFLLIFLLLNGFVASSQIIPAADRIDWTPGLPDGIPNTSSWITKNVVADFSADNSGTNNALSQIQNGIDNLASNVNHIIYFPAGTYRLEGSLSLRSNIVLRGASASNTKLEFYNPTSSACISGLLYDYGVWQNLNTSVSKGVLTLAVPNASLFEVGGFAELQQTNDNSLMTDFQGTPPPDWGQDVVGQLFEVASISGNNITFKTPVHISYNTNLSPKIRPIGLISNIGIEGMHVTLKTDTDVSLIAFGNAAYCWVKDIISFKTRKAHLSFARSLGCEVRGSQFSHSYNYDGGGHGYGVALGIHTSDVLVENNSFDHLRHSMLFQLGANGNVFAYNYSQRVHGEAVVSNFVYYPPDISAHGLFAYMNLFEGNSVQAIGNSDAWGPIGPGNTYLRNRVESDQTDLGYNYFDATTHTNAIGNSFITLNDRYGLASNNIEHGNLIDGEEIWDSEVSDNNIPDSYYLTEKPEFFGNKPWPIYGLTEGYEEPLPAQDNLIPYYETNKDELMKIRGPRTISPGQSITLSIEYTALQDRRLHVALSDGNGIIQAGYFGDDAIQVSSGHGVIDVEIVVPANLSSAGTYSVFLAEINSPSPFWAAGNYIWKLNQYDVRLQEDVDYSVDLNLTTMLEGCFEESQQMMRDDLRNIGVLPLVEPYTALGYTQVMGGGETTTSSVLNVIGNDAIVDWVLVELRDPENPSIILATQSALLQRDGDIVSANGSAALTFDGLNFSSAYIAIRHRNHFGIRSEVPYPIQDVINLNFSSSLMGIHGMNSTNSIGSIRVMMSGDANHDGAVNSIDKNDYWRLQNGQAYNYQESSADFDLNGIVNPVDKNYFFSPNNGESEQLE